MRYQITINGDAADEAALRKAVATIADPLRAFATVEVALDLDTSESTKTGAVDFATEPVRLTVDLTEGGVVVIASARDGAIAAVGATADAAMAAVVAKAEAQPAGAGSAIAEPPTLEVPS